jgi:succinate-semialdehyde dehydrogenase/glutarate-semialdehyde dehydrogenase
MDGPQLLIGGKWLSTGSNGRFESRNPSNEEHLYDGPAAGAEESLAAIDSTLKGLASLRRMPPIVKSRLLANVALKLRDKKADIARLLQLETGKIDALAKAEVDLAADQFEWYAGEAMRIFERVSPAREPGYKYKVISEPIGVTGAFNSWNFPVLLLARKLAPALAAGCSMIIRPAEQGALAAQRLVETVIEAGLPPDAIALLHGDALPISNTLMESAAVRKITFTGSTAVGEQLYVAGAKTMKKLSLELGGHSPVIIDDTVDLSWLVPQLVRLKFRNGGQVCTSPTRFFVARKVAEDFCRAFAAATATMKIGDPIGDPDVEIGPLISTRRLQAIDGLIQDAVSNGARLVCGGQRAKGFARGHFYEPTILADVPDNASIMTEEPFGPVAIINAFDRLDDAIAAANRSRFGLAAFAFTRDESRKNRLIEGIECGILAVNQFFPALAEGPLGGRKSSGFGVEGGTEGIREFLVTKFVHEGPPVDRDVLQ